MEGAMSQTELQQASSSLIEDLKKLDLTSWVWNQQTTQLTCGVLTLNVTLTKDSDAVVTITLSTVGICTLIGDTFGSLSFTDPKLELRNIAVNMSNLPIQLGTLNATFTADFNFNAATADIQMKFTGQPTTQTYAGTIASWPEGMLKPRKG
jgi:hypothetical protein